MKKSIFRFPVFSFILLLCLVVGCKQQAENANAQSTVKDDLKLDEIPQVVMHTLKAKFPEAEINKWTKEKEGDIVIYDIEFKQQDRKFEADIREDGTIHNWEKEITATNLPEAIKKAVEEKYPNSNLKEIMEITAVKDGQDALEGYEVVLETADKKEVEVTVAPDGKIVEDSGEGK
jgi:uncharacterized membrane protein YkoI